MRWRRRKKNESSFSLWLALWLHSSWHAYSNTQKQPLYLHLCSHTWINNNNKKTIILSLHYCYCYLIYTCIWWIPSSFQWLSRKCATWQYCAKGQGVHITPLLRNTIIVHKTNMFFVLLSVTGNPGFQLVSWCPINFLRRVQESWFL